MLIDLLDIEKFVKNNKLEEVTNPILFEKGMIPTSGGLISTDIFGISKNDRRETYAYINLNGYFLTPHIYKILKRMDRRFESIVNGNKKYVIVNGDLVEDEENGKTGLVYLYNIWDDIDFKKNNSMIRGERIDLLNSYNKKTIFTKYWIVIPAFYRDYNLQNAENGKISHHPINDKYAKLIRLCTTLKDSSSFDFVLNNTRANIQNILVEIYDMFKEKLERKNGMIRKSLLGKSIDYGDRSVITAPNYDTERWDETIVDFKHSGVPLYQCLGLFFPFILHWLRNFITNNFERNKTKYPLLSNEGKITEYVELDEPELYFNEEYLTKKINQFIKSPSERFEVIKIPMKSKKEENKKSKNKKEYITIKLGNLGIYQYTDIDDKNVDTISGRDLTWTDLFYLAAFNSCKDKYVYVTRYPVLNYFNTFPVLINVLSTKKTMKLILNDVLYERYPIVDLNMTPDQVAINFIDTLNISNLYLQGLGPADYDGDQVTIKAIYSQEATEECRKITESNMMLLDSEGNNIRTSGHEAIQALYNLTKF